MARTTLPEMLRPLMEADSIDLPWCAVCGRSRPLERHHIVRRGAGKLFRDGKEVPKPTITLCGFGNNLSDADGRPYCHGLAHANRLHFRMDGGRLQCLVLDEPCDYLAALGMGGWRDVR